MHDRREKTICAVSTAPGAGGIAVIRVSGPKALEIVRKISKKFNLSTFKPESHKCYFTEIIDPRTNQVIDEGLITYFANGKSFTGEEVLEISCHGSPYITQKIIESLIYSGCVMADKGEFTFRAFMNGKLDLIQAEAVLSTIQANSEASAKVAFRQLEGHVSRKYQSIESDLTWCLAHIEASIDFSTEGIDVVDQNVLTQKIKNVQSRLIEIQKGYLSGKQAKNGIKIVLVGKPNAGKSSLLNLLLQEDKAIVTSIAGTTRDVIESETFYGGLKFQISDTAGLRDTQDEVEKIGVNRSLQEAEKADLLIQVVDASEPETDLKIDVKSHIGLIIFNKIDLKPVNQDEIREKLHEKFKTPVLFISCLDPKTREVVLNTSKDLIGDMSYLSEAVISTTRQYECNKYALEMIDTTLMELEKNLGSEFVAMYLKESLISIQRILGISYDDQILDRVFKEFCLGK